MTTKTKGEIVTRAYTWLGVSGLTSKPTPMEISIGLDTLEALCHELDSRNVCTNYNFEDDPDPATESGIANAYWLAAAYGTASRLAPAVGKELSMLQSQTAITALSNWSARTSVIRQLPYPNRMPRGSGNTVRNPIFQRYNKKAVQAPIECATVQLMRGSIASLTLSIDDWLDDQTVSNYEVEHTNGLTILSESLTDSTWSYQVEALVSAADYQAIQLTITTDDGNKNTFTINFNVFGALINQNV